MDEKWIMEILDSKEERRDIQINLIDKYKATLVSFTLNTPGTEKDNRRYRIVHSQAFEYILEELNAKEIEILFKERIEKPTGSEGYIIVDRDPKEIKRLMIQIEEEHFLGRLFDIDVFDLYKNQISRKDLDLKMRSCLICNRDARICMRENNHTSDELFAVVQRLIDDYFDLTIK